MPAPASPSLPLDELPLGSTARVHTMDVDAGTTSLLRAIGLTATSELRLCKAGDPCIVQVRATRIGLSSVVARRILVVPTAPEGAA